MIAISDVYSMIILKNAGTIDHTYWYLLSSVY